MPSLCAVDLHLSLFLRSLSSEQTASDPPSFISVSSDRASVRRNVSPPESRVPRRACGRLFPRRGQPIGRSRVREDKRKLGVVAAPNGSWETRKKKLRFLPPAAETQVARGSSVERAHFALTVRDGLPPNQTAANGQHS